MILSAILFSTSAIGCAVSTDFNQLVIYRIIGGVGIGVVSIISPLYISEVAVAQYRGRLVSLYQLAVTIGFLGAYLVNYQLLGYSMSNPDVSTAWWNLVFVSEVWRGMLGMETLPAIMFFHYNLFPYLKYQVLSHMVCQECFQIPILYIELAVWHQELLCV